MIRFSRRAIFAALALSACTAVFSQTAYPDKPIRLVVPYPPGGFTDILGRLLSAQLQTRLGQNVIVDNKGGGGSTIGSAMVARAPADGANQLVKRQLRFQASAQVLQHQLPPARALRVCLAAQRPPAVEHLHAVGSQRSLHQR